MRSAIGNSAVDPVFTRSVTASGADAAGGTGTAANQVQGTSANGAVDDGSNPVKVGGVASTNAPTTVAAGQRVSAWYYPNGQQAVVLTDNLGNLSTMTGGVGGDAGGVFAAINVYNRSSVFNGSGWDRQRGDVTGTWTHAPQNTVSTALSGTITTSGTTATVAFVNTARQEVINPSAATLWASWATPTVNGAGSFPIAAGGTFSTDRTTGTLTLLSTTATQPYTVNRYS